MTLPEHLFDYEAHLAACARGDRQALQRLYQQEGPRLYGVLLRLVREPAIAEDLLHDAFLRIWAGAASYDAQRGSARGWIFSVTRHLALNDLRRRQRDAPHSAQADETGEGLEASLQSTRLYQCLEQLLPERRACILHAYVDGFSHAEIAARLGAPLGTVKAWVKRSLAALRECMG
ncbi:sigma-70 family RNA polymerase sigma factor [Pseudomonas sp. 2835]|uniref:sigma-70 family RNA polymerase sigma factor n=1 Tax=Pseudomonas sp. 2835 TaxID=3156451 RepID=UPI003D221B74